MIAPMQTAPSLSIRLPSQRHHLSSMHSPSNLSSATEIIPRVYLSDLSFAENPQCLASYRITHVVSAMAGRIILPTQHHPLRGYLQVPLIDMPFAELVAYLPECTRFIHEALYDPNARVLIHCAQGISRSASVVAAFLVEQYSWTPERAIHHIQERRKEAKPNPGFVSQLEEYARSLSNHGSRLCNTPM